jgi:flagellin-specific chaperone FliS
MIEHAKQLKEAIQNFDIASIKSYLNDYPSIIEKLEELLNKH